MTSAEIRERRIEAGASLGDNITTMIEVLIEIAAQMAEANEREGFERKSTWVRAQDC
jgi:hypothetical protein